MTAQAEPLLEMRGDRQELRPGAGADRRRPRRPGRSGHGAGRRQRRRQDGAHQVHRRNLGARRRRDPLGRQPRAHPKPARCCRARHRDRVPGSRAVRQPRHRPEHVPRTRARCATYCSTRTRWSKPRPTTLARLVGDARSDRSVSRSLAVGRPAAGRRGRQGRHVELEARDHGRTDRGARRRPDGGRARSHQAARRRGHRGDHDLAQLEQRVPGRRPAGGAEPRPHGVGRPRFRIRPVRSSSSS